MDVHIWLLYRDVNPSEKINKSAVTTPNMTRVIFTKKKIQNHMSLTFLLFLKSIEYFTSKIWDSKEGKYARIYNCTPTEHLTKERDQSMLHFVMLSSGSNP